MAGAIDLLEDFKALVEAFERAGVDYAVVGALALAVHGVPRATTDIDLMVQPDQLERAMRAAAEVGYRLPAEPIRFRSGIELQRVTKVVGRDHLTLDLLLVTDALEPMWASRHTVASDEGSIRVITREALIEMKAAAGRPQDLVDIERLRSADDD